MQSTADSPQRWSDPLATAQLWMLLLVSSGGGGGLVGEPSPIGGDELVAGSDDRSVRELVVRLTPSWSAATGIGSLS